MLRRLRLGLQFGLLYFLSFLPLDLINYWRSGQDDSFDALWIGINVLRIVCLGGCWWLLRRSWGQGIRSTNPLALSLSTSLEALEVRSIMRSVINFTDAGLGDIPLRIRNTLNCCTVIPKGFSVSFVLRFSQDIV